MPRGVGRAHAPIIWLFLASLLKWREAHTMVWPSNAAISRATHLSTRDVERGLAYLRAIGKVTISTGERPRLRKKFGRILTLNLLGGGQNPVVHFPSARAMAGIWTQVARVREKAASTVALAVAVFVLAADIEGEPISEATSLHASLKSIRALVGAGSGSTFYARLGALVEAGVISKVGEHWRDGFVVTAPHEEDSRTRRTAPPQLRRFPRMPACDNLATLEDMIAMDAEIAASQGWATWPGYQTAA